MNLLGQQYSGAQRDATKLKHSVDEMIERMANQLDVATRLAAISRITGGVAHEIKNPLNAISLRLDLLKARTGAGASEQELIPEIDVLSREVRRLDRVVKTFLDFSRPVEVHFEELDLAALASEVATLLAPESPKTRGRRIRRPAKARAAGSGARRFRYAEAGDPQPGHECFRSHEDGRQPAHLCG